MFRTKIDTIYISPKKSYRMSLKMSVQKLGRGDLLSAIIISPLSHEVGTCWFSSVRSVCLSPSLRLCVPFISVHLSSSFSRQSCRRAKTIRSPYAGLMLAHRYDADTTFVQYRVTGSCLVSRSMWASVTDSRANINPALAQNIVPVPPA